MASQPFSPVQGWFSTNATKLILLVITATGGFVLGQARGDATQDAKIQSLEQQVDKKVSREEFAQFTKSVETQLQMINENLMALRREQRGR